MMMYPVTATLPEEKKTSQRREDNLIDITPLIRIDSSHELIGQATVGLIFLLVSSGIIFSAETQEVSTFLRGN